MTQTQEFRADVGQVIQAATVNQIHQGHGRALTRQERITLNDQVRELEEKFGVSGRDTWLSLHRAIGVGSIDELCISQLGVARELLGLMRENAELKNSLGGANVRPEDAEAVRSHAQALAKALKKERSGKKALETELSEQSDLVRRITKQCEAKKSEADRANQLWGAVNQQCRQMEVQSSDLYRRHRRLRAISAVLLVGTLGGAAGTYSYWAQARTAAWSLTVCAFEGKGYAIGSIIGANPRRECARTGDGKMVWVPINGRPGR